LGLSIALEDARLHGGWLEAWGEPGRGSVFRLTLPRRLAVAVATSPLPLEPIEYAQEREPLTEIGEPYRRVRAESDSSNSPGAMKGTP
jgi:two-component system sensor histidine kinase MtrB